VIDYFFIHQILIVAGILPTFLLYSATETNLSMQRLIPELKIAF